MAMLTPGDLMQDAARLRRLVEAQFLVVESLHDGVLPSFVIHPSADLRDRFLRLRAQVEPLDLLPVLRRRDGRTVVTFVPRPPRAAWRWQVNLALLAATLVTTFLAGYTNTLGLVREGYLSSAIGGGLAFSLSLMLILGTHEMGHKIFAIRRGVDASLPYFIPMAPPLGTMGAVIITRTPSPNRDALMDVAAAGPLAGFLMAIPVLIVGVSRSFVISPTSFDGINLPDPLLLQWLIRAILHPAEGMVVLGHPMLFAGWIGLLVTSLNLLPAGMLDGGHVVRALLGPQLHRVLSVAAVVGAVLLGYWLMALVILALMRRGHPGPLDDVSPASPGRVVVGVILLAVFILSVVPLGLPF